MRVLVTGSSGCLGQVLIPALCADTNIESITGIDLRESGFRHDKLRFLRLDMRSVPASLLRSHDALVHLAFVVLRGRMSAAAMRQVNVAGSMQLLRRAADQHIRRLLVLSSAAVYGTGLDLDENTALAPLPGFCYGEHKAELDQRIAQELPRSIRLRAHVILGAHAQPLLRWLLRQPFYPRTGGVTQQLQCVHELDVVTAIRLALGSDCHGAFNLAAAPSFSFADALSWLDRRPRAIPLEHARVLLTWIWRLTGHGGEPGWIDGLTQSLTLSCERARLELGWRAQYSTLDALNATVR
jgi:nucleoside-diphosphate-sugar epimerase